MAEVELGEGPSEVRRIDGQRVALVRANLGVGSLGQAVDRVLTELEELEWPAALSYVLSGQSEEWDRSQASLLLALALARQGRYEESLPHFERAIDEATRALPPGHLMPAALLGNKGDALAKMGRHAEAEAALLRAYNDLNAAVGPAHRRTRTVAGYLAELCRASGRTADADRWAALAQERP